MNNKQTTNNKRGGQDGRVQTGLKGPGWTRAGAGLEQGRTRAGPGPDQGRTGAGAGGSYKIGPKSGPGF